MAVRLRAESVDKSLPLPSNYLDGIIHTNTQVPVQKGVLNILNLKDDYCFLWCILGHIHIDDKHTDEPLQEIFYLTGHHRTQFFSKVLGHTEI